MTATAAQVASTKAVAARLVRMDVEPVWFDGWQYRGVDLPFGPPKAHLCHWDASTILSGEWGAIGIIINGRGGANPVPGPLSQHQIPRCLNGIPRVGFISARRCNHGGSGGPFRLADGTVIPLDSANRWCSGSESAWAGPTEKPTPAFLHAYDALGAAVSEVYDVPVLHVISHEEWTEGNPVQRAPRKPDIGETIHRVRRNAVALLAGALPAVPASLLERLMSLDPTELAEFEAAMTRAQTKALTAVVSTWSPYIVQALHGVPNSVFPKAGEWQEQGRAEERAEQEVQTVHLTEAAALLEQSLATLGRMEPVVQKIEADQPDLPA